MNTNIVLMGVNHSGTSVVAEMLKRLGWLMHETQPDYLKRNEIQWVNEINTKLMYDIRKIEKCDIFAIQREMEERIQSLEEPWVVKSPSFTLTLGFWIFPKNTILIYLDRDVDRLKLSFRARKQFTKEKEGEYGHTVEELRESAHQMFIGWKGIKFRIDYMKIREAISVFDPSRAAKNKKLGKSGW